MRNPKRKFPALPIGDSSSCSSHNKDHWAFTVGYDSDGSLPTANPDQIVNNLYVGRRIQVKANATSSTDSNEVFFASVINIETDCDDATWVALQFEYGDQRSFLKQEIKDLIILTHDSRDLPFNLY